MEGKKLKKKSSYFRSCGRLVGLLGFVSSILIGGVLYGGDFQPILCTLIEFDCPQVIIKGTTNKGFESIRNVFESHFHKGDHRTAQFAAYYKGELVVDLWGTYGNHTYNEDSLQIVFSNSKTMSALAMAVAVDKGYLKYDAPVATYWPEFGKHGKDKIKVEDVLRHEAGLPWFKEPFTAQDIIDRNWDAISRLIEDTTPFFPNGTNRCYHGFTRDMINSEILRRVDPKHRSIGVFLKEEVFDKMDAEFYLGTIQPENFHRIFPTALPNPFKIMLSYVLPYFARTKLGMDFIPDLEAGVKSVVQILFDSGLPDIQVFDKYEEFVDLINYDQRVWQSELPSVNGMTNARSGAKIAYMMSKLGKHNDTVTILSKETMLKGISNPVEKFDFGAKSVTAMSQGGWALYDKFSVIPNQGNDWKYGFYGWAGFGGSMIIFNPEKEIGLAYVPTGMKLGLVGDTRGWQTINEFMKCIKNIS